MWSGLTLRRMLKIEGTAKKKKKKKKKGRAHLFCMETKELASGSLPSLVPFFFFSSFLPPFSLQFDGLQKVIYANVI